MMELVDMRGLKPRPYRVLVQVQVWVLINTRLTYYNFKLLFEKPSKRTQKYNYHNILLTHNTFVTQHSFLLIAFLAIFLCLITLHIVYNEMALDLLVKSIY